MTMAFLDGPSGLVRAAPAVRGDRVTIDETLWGYVVRAEARHAGAAWLARRLAFLVASAAVVLIGYMWLLPGAGSPLGKVGATGLLTGFAGLALWLAGRGFAPETHVDLRLKEVREVLRDIDGRTRLVGRTAFADIGGVHIDRFGQPAGQGRLVLRWRNTGRKMTVAAGSETVLAALRDRIGRDLLQGNV
ncbi:hypothetical protein [Histidinibacterium lentulum]|uniref:Uncharacterized protein n=1 Tax=Histidinibacterium lentulum TaxID=2480588 RepID=A0A3N2R4H4_9RHOB|nr:hypothetical protein [Histidinibacterium lentulum]ROU02384.1 hypothetical protein EAT49_08555 [Histidinibacterium lentulum]